MARRGRLGNLAPYLFIIVFAGVVAIQVFNGIVSWIKSITLDNTLNYIYENSSVIAVAMVFTLLLFGLRYLMSDKIREWENKQRQQCLAKDININDILNSFNGFQFEHYVAKIFECLGYKAEVTQATGDCGKDIVMWKKDENNIKKKYVVEVKRYTDKKVSRGELQKLHSAMMTNGADEAYFVTTSEFSSKAIEHAPLCNIKLINKQKLKEMIAEVMLNENTDLDSLNEITSVFKHREII